MPDDAFEIVISPDLEAGVSAEALTGWFTAYNLVLDFTSPTGEGPLLVTARVRVPATAALEVRRALDGLIRAYELEYGEVHRPRPRGET